MFAVQCQVGTVSCVDVYVLWPHAVPLCDSSTSAYGHAQGWQPTNVQQRVQARGMHALALLSVTDAYEVWPDAVALWDNVVNSIAAAVQLPCNVICCAKKLVTMRARCHACEDRLFNVYCCALCATYTQMQASVKQDGRYHEGTLHNATFKLTDFGRAVPYKDVMASLFASAEAAAGTDAGSTSAQQQALQRFNKDGVIVFSDPTYQPPEVGYSVGY